MPIAIKRNSRRNLTTFICSGNLKLQEIRDAVKDLYEHDATPYLVWDFSQAISTEADYKALSDWRSAIPSDLPLELHKNGKTAVIAPKDVMYGIARIAESLFEPVIPHKIRVFRSEAAALEWLFKERDSSEEGSS